MVSISTVRGAVVEYLSEKVEFRASKKDRPWESKNERCAKSLHRVVEYVKDLPDDDPTLLKLAGCDALFFEGFFDAPKDKDGRSNTDAAAIHCGPRGKVIDPAECGDWFAWWVETAIKEAQKLVDAGSHDPD